MDILSLLAKKLELVHIEILGQVTTNIKREKMKTGKGWYGMVLWVPYLQFAE